MEIWYDPDTMHVKSFYTGGTNSEVWEVRGYVKVQGKDIDAGHQMMLVKHTNECRITVNPEGHITGVIPDSEV